MVAMANGRDDHGLLTSGRNDMGLPPYGRDDKWSNFRLLLRVLCTTDRAKTSAPRLFPRSKEILLRKFARYVTRRYALRFASLFCVLCAAIIVCACNPFLSSIFFHSSSPPALFRPINGNSSCSLPLFPNFLEPPPRHHHHLHFAKSGNLKFPSLVPLTSSPA